MAGALFVIEVNGKSVELATTREYAETWVETFNRIMGGGASFREQKR